ncbi:MAG: hypothetical protein ACTSRS_11105 [Candidatus Helarchaeota archaeon]
MVPHFEIKKQGSEQAAQVISFLSISPFQIVVYMAFAFTICETFLDRVILNTISGIFYLVLPFLPLYYVTKKHKIENYSINREDRLPVLLFQVIGFIGASIFYYLYPTFTGLNTTPLLIFTIGYTILNFLCIPITSLGKFKISLHMTGAASSITALVIVMGEWWALLYLFCIPIGWARVKLRAHSPAQVIVGTFLGALVIFLTFLSFGYISILR